MADQEPISIAVIGIGCRFPGGSNNTEDLWSILSRGLNTWTDVPEDRFRWESFYHPSPERQGCMNHRGGHFIQQDVSTFDADFFGISPLEAKAVDPQQRLLLETSYEAMEDASIPIDKFKGSATAVYAATFANDYDRMLSKDPNDLTPYHLVGTGSATFANRISHAFDLTGPSVTIDTGCSGSLVAVHQACQSLRSFESDMAIAGGAVLILNPDHMIAMSPLQILNEDGRCYSFDSRGSGYGRGEGAGIVLLKRLSDAVRDGDRIRAVVRNTASNQDGRTTGIALPNQSAQESLARLAFRNLDISPADIQYLEAHATGTVAGDRAEIGAIRNIYCKDRKLGQPLIVGTIKPNIGHLESASGVAGLIKAILCIEKGLIPPNLLFESAKPGLLLDDDKIKIPRSLDQWPTTSARKLAVINNFGYGGTNAIIVLEARPNRTLVQDHLPPQIHPPIIARWPDTSWQLFQFSAKSETSLASYLKDVKARLHRNLTQDIITISHLLSKRSAFQWRLAVVAKNANTLVDILQKRSTNLLKARAHHNVFVFTGQGAQWPKMGCDLMTFSEYSQSIRRSDELLRKLGASWSLKDELLLEGTSSRIHDSRFAQPATTALQIAVVDLLHSWNAIPHSVVGHSSGEIAAAYAANILLHEDALKVAYYRGMLADLAQQKTNESGAMIAVGLGQHDLEDYIHELGLSDHANVACINSPYSVTVSGTEKAVSHLYEALHTKGTFVRRLRVNTAYHTRHMEAIADFYLDRISDIHPRLIYPATVMYSTITAQRELTSFHANYWVKNLTSPVRFSETIANLVLEVDAAKKINFVELANSNSSWSYMPSVVRGQDAVQSLLQTAASLFESGCDIRVSETSRSISSVTLPLPCAALPSYHWDRKRFWHEPRLSSSYRQRSAPPHDLLGLRVLTSPDDEPSWRILIGQHSVPWFKNHIIDGFSVFPATAYLATAIEAMKQWQETPTTKRATFEFSHVTFKRLLHVPATPSDVELILRLRRDGSSRSIFNVYSVSEKQWNHHCEGRIRMSTEEYTKRNKQEQLINTQHLRKELDTIREACTETVNREVFYDTLRCRGNDYSGPFSSIRKVQISRFKAVATIQIPDISFAWPSEYNSTYSLHPAIFDAFLQVPVFLFARSQQVFSVMPTSFKHITVDPQFQAEHRGELVVSCKLYDITTRSSAFDIVAFQADEFGDLQPVVRCHHCQLRATGEADNSLVTSVKNAIFQMKWEIDPASLTFEDLESCERSTIQDVKFQEEKLYHILDIAAQYITIALEELNQLGRAPVEGYLEYAFQSLARHINNRHELLGTGAFEKNAQVLDLGVEGELLHRIGPSLSAIISGEKDPLALLLEDQLLYRIYQDDSTAKCNAYLIEYIRRLAFKNPALRILEIGAGTGGSTKPLFETLSPEYKPFSACYHFTDISSGFFDQARESLGKWEDCIILKQLDIERDPLSQGFENHSYDLIIASNVLHATSKIGKTLKNVHQLLRTGGILAITELIHDNAFYGMTFGLLPGWWSGIEDGRVDGPLLSVARWGYELQQASFTQPEITAFDFPGKAQRAAFMVSRATSTSIPNGYDVYQAKILNFLGLGHPGQKLVTPLSKQLMVRGYEITDGSFDEEYFCPNCSYIILDSHQKPVLGNCTPEQFRSITGLVALGAPVFWLTISNGKTATFEAGGGLVIGFSRTARAESDTLRFVTVDIQDEVASCADSVSVLAADIISSTTTENSRIDSNECEYRIANGKLLIPRISKEQNLDDIASTQSDQKGTEMVAFHSPERLLRLQIRNPGLINSLEFVDSSFASKLDGDEVEIEIKACGINLKDVRVALGQSKPTDDFVGECAGIITNVGANLNATYKIGDRVCALTLASYGNKVRARGSVVHKLPASMSTVDGAAIPVAFFTAYYSLINSGALQKGQRVLIHEGSGPFGQAAIQIAQHFRADIFTTATNDEDRHFLVGQHGISEDHIFSSQPMSFTDAILRLTQGEGVDLAVGYFSNESLSMTWDCMAELGTVIDVGGLENDQSPHLYGYSSSRGLTFSLVDVSLLARRRPHIVHKVLDRVLTMFEEGSLRPIDLITRMPISEVKKAFRMMQDQTYSRKIVLEASPAEAVTVVKKQLYLEANSIYIIVGGLGKFGRHICQHLVELGAGNIILLSRKALNHAERKKLENQLSTENTTVRIVSCDASKLEEVNSLADQLSTGFRPVKGIFQASMVLQDRNLNEMTLDDFHVSIAPKYIGTQNLIRAFESIELDFFLMLSSLSGIVGLPGQANYAAGNTYLDHITYCRPPKSWKRFVSLDLPLLADTHLLSKEEQPRLIRRGMQVIPNHALFPYLDYAINPEAGDRCQQIIIGLDMRAASEDNQEFYSKNPIFNYVFAIKERHATSNPSTTNAKSAIEQIMSGSLTSTKNPESLIILAIREKISSLLAIDASQMDAQMPIVNLGLDSLIAIELKNWITKLMQAPMKTSDILDAKGIMPLARMVLQRTSLQTTDTAHQTNPNENESVLIMKDKATHSKHMEWIVEVPKQPLQALETILDSFYKSVVALGSEHELSRAQAAIENFKQSGTIGHVLQSRLARIADDESVDSWLSEIYNQSFWLRRRAPLRPAMNFFSSHVLSSTRHTQAERAALLSLAGFNFKQKLTNGQVPQDFVNDEPQCMDSLNWIFNCYRRPGLGCDTTLKFPENDFILVMRHGHIYKIPLTDRGIMVSFGKLMAIFETILRIVPNDICWASMLTTGERNMWAQARTVAINTNAANEEYFSVIEQSLFIVCLDDGSPETSDERAKSFLLDNNSNRWNDKTLSFIVCENGVSAFWCEHSMIDGTTMDQLGQAITRAIIDHRRPAVIEEVEIVEGQDFIYYSFVSSPEIDKNIVIIRQQYEQNTQNIDFAIAEIPYFGEQTLRQHKFPPKGVVQAIISLAIRRHFGHNPASYEAVNLRSFRLGRMDIYQFHTPEMESFVSALSFPSYSHSSDLLRKLLQEAAHAHATGIANISRGRGWDRQLTALRCVLESDEEEPELFSDDLFLRTRPRKVFVSFSGTGMPEWGSVWRDPEALWIGVEVFGDRFKLCVASGVGRARKFCGLVMEAARAVRRVVES
ncbi:putative polyketide synthase [Lojkania enalia]|uniref:Polyketide synthase n=1 Tax=Lojkania enalia TaxID=147567 RepID=A0A9P4K7Y5_9PLEO|nr:putative polyketide synthase [Didymosphaeria enalia]